MHAESASALTADRPINARPGFPAAVRHSTAASLAFLDQAPRFYRTIGDIPTYALGVLALYLHSIDRLYHRGFRDVAKDLFSAGRATAILGRMQSAGLIVPRDAFQTGKQRRYTPAPAMLQAFRACYLIELKSLALLDDRGGTLVETYDQSGVFDQIVAFLALRHMAAPALDQELVDPLGGIGRRSMGLMLAYALAQTAFDAGRARPEGTIDLNVANLSIRLGVSRTHTRRLLIQLQDAALISDYGRAHTVTLTPAFADGYELYFFGMFSILLEAVGLTSPNGLRRYEAISGR